VLTARLGSEVLVDFVGGDIDRPLIVGQLYNGQDRPPLAGGGQDDGEPSGANHPGVLSGWHSKGLDDQGFHEWVLDDATGQLRMRWLVSYTLAEVGLGHLIQQVPGSAHRGAVRGAGFEAGTQGWATLRAGQGMLVTTSNAARCWPTNKALGTAARPCVPSDPAGHADNARTSGPSR